MDKVLGREVKDIITGFKGIAVAKIEYLTGCNQYEIKPQVDKDGKMVDPRWLDESQVEVIGEGIRKAILKKLESVTEGGPNPLSNMPERG
jgi:hypothetical protein